MRSTISRTISLLIAIILACFSTSLTFASTTILISESIGESPAIKSIVDGVVNKTTSASILISSDLSVIDIKNSTADNKYIILGTELLEKATKLPKHIKAVGGGVYRNIPADLTFPTISLFPSLSTVISEIEKTGFKLKTIHTVATPEIATTTGLSSANDSFEATGVFFNAKISTTEKDTARSWFEILRDIDPAEEAILISDNTYIESSGSYRAIIETAWKKNILVISAQPKFASRGVSIGLVPDLVRYGEILAEIINQEQSPTVISSTMTGTFQIDISSVNRVFNKRTLNKIGFSLPIDIDKLGRDDIVIE